MSENPINRNYCGSIIPWEKNKNCQKCIHFPQFGKKCVWHRFGGDSYSFLIIDDGHQANDCDIFETMSEEMK